MNSFKRVRQSQSPSSPPERSRILRSPSIRPQLSAACWAWIQFPKWPHPFICTPMSISKSGNHCHHRIVTPLEKSASSSVSLSMPNDNIHDNGSRDQSFIEFLRRIHSRKAAHDNNIIIIIIFIPSSAPAAATVDLVLTNNWNASSSLTHNDQRRSNGGWMAAAGNKRAQSQTEAFVTRTNGFHDKFPRHKKQWSIHLNGSLLWVVKIETQPQQQLNEIVFFGG